MIPIYCWFAVPPISLYFYSMIFTPLFGPARYTLFVAPAFLILLAIGLTRLPSKCAGRWRFCRSSARRMLATNIYPNDRHADSCAAGRWIKVHQPNALVVVLTDDPKVNHEVDVARFYAPGTATIASLDDLERLFASKTAPTSFLVAVSLRDRKPVVRVSDAVSKRFRERDAIAFPGLKISNYTKYNDIITLCDPVAKKHERSSTKAVSPPVR